HTRWPRDWSSDVCSSDLCGRRCRIEGADSAPPRLQEAGRAAPATSRHLQAGGDPLAHPPWASVAPGSAFAASAAASAAIHAGTRADRHAAALALLRPLTRPLLLGRRRERARRIGG